MTVFVTLASARGYTPLIINSDDDARLLTAVETLIARRVEGIVLATARQADRTLAACLDAGVPTVLVNRSDDTSRVSRVSTGDLAGMALAVEHLVGQGHRRIGHIAGPLNVSTGSFRRDGFNAAMQRAGLAGPVSMATAFNRTAGQIAAARLLHDHALTAIVASNDMLAIGVYAALAELGLRCPDDISIVGHNDMPMMDMVHPPLTTVRIDPEAMGQEAAELLLAHIDDPRRAVTVLLCQPKMVLRGSTRPILLQV